MSAFLFVSLFVLVFFNVLVIWLDNLIVLCFFLFVFVICVIVVVVVLRQVEFQFKYFR